jgi:hypothetical protein
LHFAAVAAALSAIALPCAGCGAPPAPDLHAAFRRIQEQEAIIAHRAPEAAHCAREAPCPAAEAVCAAASSICAIAAEIRDADADARCELARRRCAEGDAR